MQNTWLVLVLHTFDELKEGCTAIVYSECSVSGHNCRDIGLNRKKILFC